MKNEGYIQDLMDDFSEILTLDDLENVNTIYVGYDMALYNGLSRTKERCERFRKFLELKEKNEESN